MKLDIVKSAHESADDIISSGQSTPSSAPDLFRSHIKVFHST